MDWAVTWGSDIDGAWSAWLQGVANALGSGVLYLGVVIATAFLLGLLLVVRATRRRTFWCVEAQREVEVKFDERGWLGVRPLAVQSCSCFDPPSCVQCHRRCLDSAFRRQWEPAVPVHWSHERRGEPQGTLPRVAA